MSRAFMDACGRSEAFREAQRAGWLSENVTASVHAPAFQKTLAAVRADELQVVKFVTVVQRDGEKSFLDASPVRLDAFPS